jgi:hypothetical protein
MSLHKPQTIYHNKDDILGIPNVTCLEAILKPENKVIYTYSLLWSSSYRSAIRLELKTISLPNFK